MRTCLLLTAILSLSLTGCGKKPDAPQPVGNPPPVAAIIAATPATTQTDLVARWHFVGGNFLSSNTNASVLRDILGLPATAKFHEHTLQKLARAPFRLLHPRLATTNDFSTLLRPLLDDLLTAESFAEVRGTNDATRNLVLAVRLTGSQAQLWNSNLVTVLQTWTGIPVVQTEPGVWELKKHHAPNLLRVIHAGDWLVLGAGLDRIALLDSILAQIKNTGRPIAAAKDYWFSTTTDWSRLALWLAWPTTDVLPPGLAEIKVTGEGDSLRVKGKLAAARPLNWKPEPWTIPTNLIREPLISFTAGQGVAGRLAHHHLFPEFAITPPNQFYVWALAQIPFQTFVAVPVKDASNTLARIAPQLIAKFKTNASPLMGSLNYVPTNGVISWSGLPFVTPFAEAVSDQTGGFLFAGLFPNTPTKTLLPAELLARIQGRTNLVYYDWEITEERLRQWRNLNELTQIIADRELHTGDHPQEAWLTDVGPKLGNSITEITLAAPHELALNRKSPIGLTAIELLTLVKWLDSDQFPHGGFPWSLHPAKPLAPAPPAR